MPQIVTTSSNRRARQSAKPIVIAVMALLAIAIAVYFLQEGSTLSEPQPPDIQQMPTDPVAAIGGKASGHAAPVKPRDNPLRGQDPSLSTFQPFTHSTSSVVEDVPASTDSPPKPKRKHFPHPSEQLLALMLSTPPEISMPPLPQLDPDDAQLNADALAALTNDLVIYDTDGERLERLKEDVADIKFQLAEIVSEGGSVAEALNEFRTHQNTGVQVRSETIDAINAIEDDAAAVETFERVNKELEKENIVPIRPEEVGFVIGDADESASSDRR